jgi:hypothetical protein
MPKPTPTKAPQLRLPSSRASALALNPTISDRSLRPEASISELPHDSKVMKSFYGPVPEIRLPSSRPSILALNPTKNPPISSTVAQPEDIIINPPHKENTPKRKPSICGPTPQPSPRTRTQVPLSTILRRITGGQQTQVHGLFRTPHKPPLPQFPSSPAVVPDTETFHTPEKSDDEHSYAVQLAPRGKSYFNTAIETLNQLNDSRPRTTIPRSKTGCFKESTGHREAALNMTMLDLAASPTRRSRTQTNLPFKPPTRTQTPGVVTQVIRKRNMTITRFAPPTAHSPQVQKNIRTSSKRKNPGDQNDAIEGPIRKRTKLNLSPMAENDIETSFQQVREAW